MKWMHFLFCIIVLCIACHKEDILEDNTLSKVIIGKWQMIQVMGFPYSLTEWETLPYEGPIYEFYHDGTYFELVNSLDPQTGTYKVNDTTYTIQVVVKDLREEESSIIIINHDEIIFSSSGIEGPIKYKYKRLE